MATTYLQRLAPAGFHILTKAEVMNMITALGGELVTSGYDCGGALKEAGLINWATPNTEATDSSGFSGIGSGLRDSAGEFADLLLNGCIWVFDEDNPEELTFMQLENLSGLLKFLTNTDYGGDLNTFGLAVRCAMDVPGDYVEGMVMEDGDGNEYDLVQIGDVVVTKQNLATTKYNDESPISLKINNADWIADTEGAYCAYPGADTMREVTTSQTESALVVYGSQDCKRWFPVAGTKNIRDWVEQITTSPKSGVYKYYIVVFAGRIELCELKNIDMVFGERYLNRLR